MDAMEFFQRSAGRWRSQRVTHHLAFRRAEIGESTIRVEALGATNPEIVRLCEFHQVDPATASGGCCVSWDGLMGWDKDGENHAGQTIFALVPDADNFRRGRLLRDVGYAEIVPVIGYYHLDEEDGLVLTTDYETMSSIERFWFASPDIRMRSSTVKRFGGFSTASFCTEMRVAEDHISQSEVPADAKQASSRQYFSALGW